MAGEKPTTVVCSVIGMDCNNLSYKACAVCERTLLDNPTSFCKFCNVSKSKRLFRLLVSIATETNVVHVMCFDRAARVLFGCSADEFFDFAKIHPFAAANAGKILVGEMFKMTLSKPKNGYSQHLRAVSVVPLKTNYRPAIETMRKLYGVTANS